MREILAMTLQDLGILVHGLSHDLHSIGEPADGEDEARESDDEEQRAETTAALLTARTVAVVAAHSTLNEQQ